MIMRVFTAHEHKNSLLNIRNLIFEIWSSPAEKEFSIEAKEFSIEAKGLRSYC